jgi:mRNA interferase RelE/StbE
VRYRIEFVSSAQRDLLRLPKADRQRIAPRIDVLADDPRPTGCAKLSGLANLWRLRVGAYRVIYSIEDAALLLTITRVSHRRDAYRGL